MSSTKIKKISCRPPPTYVSTRYSVPAKLRTIEMLGPRLRIKPTKTQNLNFNKLVLNVLMQGAGIPWQRNLCVLVLFYFSSPSVWKVLRISVLPLRILRLLPNFSKNVCTLVIRTKNYVIQRCVSLHTYTELTFC